MNKKIYFIILFGIFISSLCTPIREIDFFWHLATGNWILNAGVLPSIDPFSYTAPAPDNRDSLILQGYWLSQVTYATLWKIWGEGGVVALRVLILCGLFASVYGALKRRGVSSWFALLAIFPICLDMRLPISIGDRPQLWSFLLVSLLVLILDTFPEEGRTKKMVTLCLLTILWSNLHPGILLGSVIVSIYLICTLGRNLTGARDWPSFLGFGLVLFSSILSPAGYKIYSTALEIFTPSREMKVYLSSNLDGTDLIKLWNMGNFDSWGFLLVFLLCMVTIVFRFKKMCAEHLAMLVMLSVMAFLSARYMIFLTILGTQITLPYWQDVLLRFQQSLSVRKMLPVFVSLLLIFSSFTMYKQQGSVFIEGALSEVNYPKGAVNYLKRTHPPGNLFNIYEWGGYLMVYLPEYKVYIDGRGLGANKGSMIEYLLIRGAVQPFWKNIFTQKGIDVVLSLKDDPNGFASLNEALFVDPDWTLAYQDNISLVFVRKRS